jgi:chromosomal replication initiation ATPase DnaA
MTDDTWGQVREELLKAVGKNNFSAWIAPIAFDRMDGRTAMFHVPTTFFGSWVSQNYGDVIRRTLASNGVGADRVEFHVGPSEPVQAGNGAGAPRRENRTEVDGTGGRGRRRARPGPLRCRPSRGRGRRGSSRSPA